MTPSHFVALAVILFVIGAVGVLVRRNAMVIFMCVELMLNAVNLAFSMSSTHMKITMALRRTRTPTAPITNKITASATKWLGVMTAPPQARSPPAR